MLLENRHPCIIVLKVIESLKSTGMSIKKIKNFIDLVYIGVLYNNDTTFEKGLTLFLLKLINKIMLIKGEIEEIEMRLVLEIFRIIVIFFIVGAALGGLLKIIYKSIGINVDNTNGGWLVGFSILIFFFILYRNKLQFQAFIMGKEG